MPKNSRDALRELFGMHEERSDSPDFDAADPANQAIVERWQAYIRETIATKTVAQWLEILEAAGVAASPFRLPEEIADDPHVRATGMVVELEHPITGPQVHAGPLIEMSETPAVARGPSPTTGQHTTEVLVEVGFSTEEVAALFKQGVVE